MDNGQTDPAAWAQGPAAHHSGAAANDDDFANLFDFENMDIVDFHGYGDGAQQQRLPDGFDRDSASRDPDHAARHWAMTNKFQQQQQHAQQQLEQQQQHLQNQHYQMGRNVPPTPTSAELFPSQYLEERRGQLQDGRFVGRLDDLNMFTPDMTPNVTGSDSVFSVIPAYAMPGSYMNALSPLTSPAMRPQNQNGAFHASTAGSSLAASPVDLSLEPAADGSSSAERPRKTRKKAAAASTTSTQATRARATSKAGATKRRLSLVGRSAPDKTPKGALVDGQDGTRSQPPSGHLNLLTSQHDLRDNSSKSISPRPLTEARMAPPPKPQPPSSGPPARVPLERLQQTGLPPATPASLMRLQTKRAEGNFSPLSSSQQSPLTGTIEAGMGFLALPESAAPLDLGQTGRSSAKPPIPSPAPSTRPGSAMASPTGALARGQSKSSSSRKRGSQSNLVSPALRPRISPSIKPLLPEGGHPNLSQDQHALLLASKSNYQNLLEGNRVPGVEYPSDLATNLTSKRTSHKIAEQGRRNRINTALQEMQSLLPPALSKAAANDMPVESMANSPTGDGETAKNASGKASSVKGDSKASSAAQNGNSKAATVELAIQYIKSLGKVVADKDAEVARLKEELARLKKSSGDGSEEDREREETPTSSPAISQSAAAEKAVPTQTKAESTSGSSAVEGEDMSSTSSTNGSADSVMADA